MANFIMAERGAGVLGAWFAPRSSGAPRTKHQTRQQGQKTKSDDCDDNYDDNKTNANKHTTQNTTKDGGSETSLLRLPHTFTTPPLEKRDQQIKGNKPRTRRLFSDCAIPTRSILRSARKRSKPNRCPLANPESRASRRACSRELAGRRIVVDAQSSRQHPFAS